MKQRADGTSDGDTDDDLRWVEENIPATSSRSKVPMDFLDEAEVTCIASRGAPCWTPVCADVLASWQVEVFDKRTEQAKLD